MYILNSNFRHPFFLAHKKMKTPTVIFPCSMAISLMKGFISLEDFLPWVTVAGWSLNRAMETSQLQDTETENDYEAAQRANFSSASANKNILNAIFFSLVVLLSLVSHYVSNRESIKDLLWKHQHDFTISTKKKQHSWCSICYSNVRDKKAN